MGGIQGDLVKQGKRNVISRFFRAKKDKGRIKAWRLDVDEILHALNVRLLSHTNMLLIIFLQSEPVIDASVVVSVARGDIVNTSTVLSDIRQGSGTSHEARDGGMNTHTIISYVQHDMPGDREKGGQIRAVSIVHSRPNHHQVTVRPCPALRQVGDLCHK